MSSYRAAVFFGGLAVGCLAFLPAAEIVAGLVDGLEVEQIQLGLTGAALALLATAGFAGGFGLLFELLRRVHKPFRRDSRYRLRRSRAADLEYVDKTSTRFFGKQASNLTQIRQLYASDRSHIWIIEKSAYNEADHQLITREGYVIVFRLSQEGETAIHEGAFNSVCPAPEHLCGPQVRCAAVYIGAVVARFRARPYVLGTIETQLRLAKPYRSARHIYARAATKDGLRILKTHDFEPLDPERDQVGQIYVLDRRGS